MSFSVDLSVPVTWLKRLYDFTFGPPPPRKRPPIDYRAYSKISNYGSVVWLLAAMESMFLSGIFVALPFLAGGGLALLSESQEQGAQRVAATVLLLMLIALAGFVGMIASFLGLIIVSVRERRRGLHAPRLTPEQVLRKYGYPCDRVEIYQMPAATTKQPADNPQEAINA